jgi:essential nuclear protein 1
MPKATTPTSARQGRRHNPLEDDIVATGILRTKPGKRRSQDADADQDNFVDSRASKNILRIGRELDKEEEASRPRPSAPAPAPADNFGYESRFGDEPEGAEAAVYGDEDEAWGDEDEQVEEIEVDPEDLETYKRFMPDEEDDLLKHGWDRQPAGDEGGQEESVNLADLILQKIAAHEAAEARGDVAAPEDNYELPPKVVEAYTK